MPTIIHNIKELVQVREQITQPLKGKEMNEVPSIKNAYLIIEHDTIVDYGKMDDLPSLDADVLIDATNKLVMPAWCDSHTHVVYAGTREEEFVDRINGLSYEEIAARGGGILNSAEKLRKTSEDDLYEQSVARIKQLMSLGTTAIEIKSGYGLDLHSELKMLRVIRRIKNDLPIKVKSTFLGAHAIPKEYKNDKKGYVDLIINEMLPIIAEENLADYIDVFCEQGYFDTVDTDRILKAASKFKLRPKLHVNQFNSIGGIEVGVKNEALTVDHLEVLTDTDLKHLTNSSTIAVGLPLCSFFLGIPYAPARTLIDQNIPFALASDYNPGSSPSGNMNQVFSFACIKMKITPQEALNAATINATFAMGIEHEYGSISRGKKASLIITKAVSGINFLPYSFGLNHIDTVLINGKRLD